MRLSVIVDITHPPFGREQAFSGLYIASAALSKALDVIVVLSGDGVYNALKGQSEPLERIKLPPTEAQLNDIIELDGRVVADGTALATRGIDPSELIKGIEVLGTDDIHKLILDRGDHVINF